MTEKTYKERFADWFDEQKERGMINFHPSFNHEAIANHFGAEIFYDENGFFKRLDFSKTKYETIMHPEVQEYIYEGLYKFVTAPSRRISNATDKWGNYLDGGHPDHTTLERKKEHVREMRALNLDLKSRWELAMVLEGHCPPAEGRTIADYEKDWLDHIADYEAATERPWPHPRDDGDHLDGHLEVTRLP